MSDVHPIKDKQLHDGKAVAHFKYQDLLDSAQHKGTRKLRPSIRDKKNDEKWKSDSKIDITDIKNLRWERYYLVYKDKEEREAAIAQIWRLGGRFEE
jgi:ABC-type oligopeptide transport system ATPase subunit